MPQTAPTVAPPVATPSLPQREPRSWQQGLVESFGPGCLAGIRFGDWVKLLAENGLHVSPSAWGKSLHLTLSSLVTSPLSRVESACYSRRIRATEVQDVVFILGSWRSGTTFLHNLMCQDTRYAAPDLYETMYPHTYCLSRWWWEPLLKLGLPNKRFMDNMEMNFREPAEDEMACGILSGKSNMLGWTFPRREAEYERFLSFQQASPDERRAFLDALEFFVKKVQMTRGRPLLLKSPNHTARVDLILERFPQAKFIHIRRHPYDVYRSFIHMARRVIPVWGLQTYDDNQVEQTVIRLYRELQGAYLAQREQIPAGQLAEVAYEDLAPHPEREIERLYSELNLPSFATMQPALRDYLEQQRSYQKNQHPFIPADIRRQLHSEWDFCFDRWQYEKDCSDL